MEFEFSSEYLYKIQQLTLKLRKASVGVQSGIHSSIRKGHGLEFADVRPYSPGDDFRAVDWNALARTDKLYTRLYQQEQDLKVLVVLDHSVSLSLIHIAPMIALSVSYVCLCGGDSVSLLLPGIGQLPWAKSAKNFKKLVSFVSGHAHNTETHLYSSVSESISQLKLPARIFIVSDFFYDSKEIQKTLEFASRRNLEVTIILIAHTEIVPAVYDGLLVDSETLQEINADISLSYIQEESDKHIASIQEICNFYGQQSIVVSSTETLEDVMLFKLPRAGVLR